MNKHSAQNMHRGLAYKLALSITFAVFSVLCTVVFPHYAYADTLPAPTYEYDFNGTLTDSQSRSTLTLTNTAEEHNVDRDVTEHGFGQDANGTFWWWKVDSKYKRGGGFWLDLDQYIGNTYTIGMKFVFAETGSSWKKIIDYSYDTSDNGFYFYNHKLQLYPKETGSTVVPDGSVVDMIVQRTSTGQFKAFMSDINGEFHFDSPDYDVDDSSSRLAVPGRYSGGTNLGPLDPNKTRLGFFFDENRTGSEATYGGRVYSIKIWDKAVDVQKVAEELQPTSAEVKYYTNDGTDASSTVKVRGGDLNVAEKGGIPTRAGYYFLGWDTDQNATTPTYPRGGSVTYNIAIPETSTSTEPFAGPDFYAIWCPNQFEEYVHDYYSTWNTTAHAWVDQANVYLSNEGVGVINRINGLNGYDGTASTKSVNFLGQTISTDIAAFDESSVPYPNNGATASWVTRPFEGAKLYGWAYTADSTEIDLATDDQTTVAAETSPFIVPNPKTTTEYRGRLDLYPVWETHPELYKSVANKTAVDDNRSQNKSGDVLEYAVTARNSVRGSAWRDVVVSDTLPAGVDPVLNQDGTLACTVTRNGSTTDAAATYDAQTRTITCGIDTLFWNDSVTLNFSATINSSFEADKGLDDDDNRELITNVATAAGKDTVGGGDKGATSNAAVPYTTIPGEAGGGSGGGTPGPLPEGDNGSMPWVTKYIENQKGAGSGDLGDGWVTEAETVGGTTRYVDHPVVYRNISYVAGVRNIDRLDGGDDTKVTKVVLSDRLPTNTVFDPSVEPRVYAGSTQLASGSYQLSWSDNGRILTLSVDRDKLGGETSVTLHFSVTVSSYKAVGKKVTNHATVNLYHDGNIVSSGQASATAPEVRDIGKVNIVKEAQNLTATERASKNLEGGQTNHVYDIIKYSVTITNNRVYGWRGVVFYDILPKGVEYVKGSLQIQDVDQEGMDYTNLPDDAYDPVTRTITIRAGDVAGIDASWKNGSANVAPAARYEKNGVSQRQIVFRYNVELNSLAMARTTRNVVWAQGGILPFDGLDQSDADRWSHHEGDIGTKATLNAGFQMGEDNDAERLGNAVKAECPLPFTVDGEGTEYPNPKNDYLFVIDPADHRVVARLYTDNPQYEGEDALVDLVGRHINRLTGLSDEPADETFPEQKGTSARGFTALPHRIDSAYEWATKLRTSQGGGGRPGEDYEFVGWTYSPIASWNPLGTNRIILDREIVRPGVTRIYPVYRKTGSGGGIGGSGEPGGDGPTTSDTVTKTATASPTVTAWVDDALKTGCPVLGSRVHYTVKMTPAGSDYTQWSVSDITPAGMSLVLDSVKVTAGGTTKVLTEAADSEIPDSDRTNNESTFTYERKTRVLSYTCSVSNGAYPTLEFDMTIDVNPSLLGTYLTNSATVTVSKTPTDENPWDSYETGLSADATVGPVVDSVSRRISKSAYNLTAAAAKRDTTQVGDEVQYTINVHNNAWVWTWDGVVVYDQLPEGLELVPGSVVVTDKLGATHVVPSAAYKGQTRELCVGVGDLNAAGLTGKNAGHSATVTFRAKVVAVPDDDAAILTNVAHAMGGATGATSGGAGGVGNLPLGQTIGEVESRWGPVKEHVKTSGVVPYAPGEGGGGSGVGGGPGGPGGGDPSSVDALLLARYRDTNAIGRTYLAPKCMLYEPIVGRTPKESSDVEPTAGPESAEVGSVTPEGATQNAEGSANEWALKRYNHGAADADGVVGPMPDDYTDADGVAWKWKWVGWTDDPCTSWNPDGTDRLLGANDLIQMGENNVWPVYLRVRAGSTYDDGEPGTGSLPDDPDGNPETGVPGQGDPGDPNDPSDDETFEMEKGRVGVAKTIAESGVEYEPVTLYQELEYKVAAHNIATGRSWANITFMDKFPAYAELVPDSVYLTVVNYNGLTDEQIAAGQDGKIVWQTKLEESSTGSIMKFEAGKYNYDASKKMISYRILESWLDENPIKISQGESCELRFKIYITREYLEPHTVTTTRTVTDTELEPLSNEGTVTWYPPYDPTGGDDEQPHPLWVGRGTSLIGIPTDPGERTFTKVAENLTRSGGTYADDRVRYTLETANTKAYDWEGVDVLDVLPKGMELDKQSIRYTAPDGTVTVVSADAYDEGTRKLCVAVGTLKPGESAKVSFEVIVQKGATEETLANEAWVSGGDPYEGGDPSPAGTPGTWNPGRWTSGTVGPEGTSPGRTKGSGTILPDGGVYGGAHPGDPGIYVFPGDPGKVSKTVSELDGDDTYRRILAYTVVVHNDTDEAWVDVPLVDQHSAGLAYMPGTLQMLSPDGFTQALSDDLYNKDTRTIELSIGRVEPGDTYRLTYRIGVPKDFPENGEILNRVTVGIEGTPVHPKNPTKNVCEPDDPDILQKECTVACEPAWREVLEYKVTLTNPTPNSTWPDMEIFDYLPEELEYIGGTLKLTKPNGSVEFLPDKYFDESTHLFEVPVGDVSYGQTYVMEYRVGVPDEVPVDKELVNRASVEVPGQDGKLNAPKIGKKLARTGDVLVPPVAFVAGAGVALAAGLALRRRRRAR